MTNHWSTQKQNQTRRRERRKHRLTPSPPKHCSYQLMNADLEIWSRCLAYWLRCPLLTSEFLSSNSSFGSDFSFLLTCVLGGSGDSSNRWVPATHVGDPDCMPSFRLWPCPAAACSWRLWAVKWEVNQQMEELAVAAHSYVPPLFLINKLEDVFWKVHNWIEQMSSYMTIILKLRYHGLIILVIGQIEINYLQFSIEVRETQTPPTKYADQSAFI